jgi:hypothetical protein
MRDYIKSLQAKVKNNYMKLYTCLSLNTDFSNKLTEEVQAYKLLGLLVDSNSNWKKPHKKIIYTIPKLNSVLP